eukprot:m51a1_g4745 hypothetical protein (198) ;mRNA; f:388006-388653
MAAKKRVVCVGDSLTEGWITYREFHPYPARLGELAGPGVAVVNAGRRGETAAQVLARVSALWAQDASAAPAGADVAVVLVGANDLVQGEPEAGTRAALEGLVALCSSRGARAFVLTVPGQAREATSPAAAEARGRLNAWVRERYGAQALDWAAACPHGSKDAEGRRLWYKDGLHMTARGYDHLALFVHSQLVAAGAL